MSAKPKHARPHKEHGFSLLELMIALAVGGIAITSIYSIGAVSTRTFQQQQQLATAQTSLRMAMNQVKRDMARAGYLSTPNIEGVGQACGAINGQLDAPGGIGRLAAFSAFSNGQADGTGFNSGSFNKPNGYTTDDIVLIGNYTTSNEYPGVIVQAPGQIAIDPNWQSFDRDFSNWYATGAAGVNQAAIADAFVAGRMIRIQTTRRQKHFAVLSATPTNSSLTFSPALPATCDAAGGWVAPVTALRYYAKPTTDIVEIRRTNEYNAQLIREEVDPLTRNTALAGGSPPRVVLDYLVRFKLFFNMTNRAGLNPGLPLTTNDFTPVVTNSTTVNANPERVRSVRIELGARAAQVDPALPWKNSCDGLITAGKPLCFQVADTEPGAARVRMLSSEVLVPNVAYEDL